MKFYSHQDIVANSHGRIVSPTQAHTASQSARHCCWTVGCLCLGPLTWLLCVCITVVERVHSCISQVVNRL